MKNHDKYFSEKKIMSNPEAYVKEIKSLTGEIKRSNDRLNKLREQRKKKQSLLYKYMSERDIEKYEGITINSIRPRDVMRRKPEAEKRKDAIELFRQAGIPNPEEFYLEFKSTQKAAPKDGDEDESEDELVIPTKSRSKKGKKDEKKYDPFLGF